MQLQHTSISKKAFKKKLLSGKKKIILEFYTDWSGGSYLVDRFLQKLALKYENRIDIFRINADKDKSLSATYLIKRFPTLLLTHEGEVVDIIKGIQPIENIEERIDHFLNYDND